MRNQVVFIVALMTALQMGSARADVVAAPEQPPNTKLEPNGPTPTDTPVPIVQPLSRGLRQTARPVRPALPAPVASKPRAKVDEKATATLEVLEKERDLQLRREAAERLAKLGYAQPWEVYTLEELLDKENRIRLANQLREQGVDMSWAKNSYAQLLDVEKRLIRSERLLKMGKIVDWKQFSSQQLDQMEIDLCRAQARR